MSLSPRLHSLVVVTTTIRISGTKRTQPPPGRLRAKSLPILQVIRNPRQHTDRMVVGMLAWLRFRRVKMSLGMGMVGGCGWLRRYGTKPSSGISCSTRIIWEE